MLNGVNIGKRLRQVREFFKFSRRRRAKAKLQLSNYLDRLGLAEGYLVIFDPGEGTWEEKLYYRETVFNDKKIVMVGL